VGSLRTVVGGGTLNGVRRIGGAEGAWRTHSGGGGLHGTVGALAAGAVEGGG